MGEHNGSSVYCGLNDIPKPWNGSYKNVTHDKYIKIVARKHEVNGEENLSSQDLSNNSAMHFTL